MKLEDVTLSNIKSFFQGYARSYLDIVCLLPHYTKEQVFYRIYVCKETCVPYKQCEVCKCDAIKKSYSTKSCSPDKFPNLMSKLDWERYKIDKKIDEKIISKIMVEVDLIFNNPKL